MRKPKIVVWDIETSPIQAWTWSLYNVNIGHKQIIKDWSIICACWKELGKGKVHYASVLGDPKRFAKDHLDDYHVVKKLREMLEDVDILVAHNGDRFDLKKFNARLAHHGLPPIGHILTVDTLKEARKFAKITTNRLDYLGTYFNVGNKIKVDQDL